MPSRLSNELANARGESFFGLYRMIFGAEYEVRVTQRGDSTPQDPDRPEWEPIAQKLHLALQGRQIQSKIIGLDREPKYQEWLIAMDMSIMQNLRDNWGIELVSSMNLSPFYANWEGDCVEVWDVLLEEFDIDRHSTCGTHIHVSPFDFLGWRPYLDWLKRLAKAIVYFEECIDALMPVHRLDNTFCLSNRWNTVFRSLGTADVFQAIDAVEDAEQLAQIMCPEGRDYRWNFSRLGNATEDWHLSIEFRQPPGCINAEKALVWVELTLGFVAGATWLIDHPDVSVDPDERPGVDDLRLLVARGVTQLSRTWVGAEGEPLTELFQGRLGEGRSAGPGMSEREQREAHLRAQQARHDKEQGQHSRLVSMFEVSSSEQEEDSEDLQEDED